MEARPVDLLSVEHSIRMIRHDKVILDEDLAVLYGVEVKRLNEQVRRNIDRFPADFLFQLTNQEFADLRFQSGTSSQWGGRRTPPYAFTEQGVAMHSIVLHSPQAVRTNSINRIKEREVTPYERRKETDPGRETRRHFETTPGTLRPSRAAAQAEE